MSLFESGVVKATRRALAAAGSGAQLVKLDRPAATPSEAAALLGVAAGAVVSVQVYLIGEQPAMALVAGDRRCAPAALPRVLNLDGEAVPASAAKVSEMTGCPAEAVPPVGPTSRLPAAIDVSLKRFATVYAPAGHPRYVFATGIDELKRLTGGIVSYNLTEGAAYHPVAVEPVGT